MPKEKRDDTLLRQLYDLWQQGFAAPEETMETVLQPFVQPAAVKRGLEETGEYEDILTTLPMGGVVYGGAPATRSAIAQLIKEARKRGLLKGVLKKGFLQTLKKGVVVAEEPSRAMAKEAAEKGLKSPGGYFAPRPPEPVVPRTPLRGPREEKRLLRALEEGNVPAEIYAKPGSRAHEWLGHGTFRGMQPAEKAAMSRAGVRAPHPRATYQPVGEETFAYSISAPQQAQQEVLDYIELLKKFQP